MVSKEELQASVDKMILSASGWRGVFAADCDEESTTDKISQAHEVFSAAVALVFAEYLKNTYDGTGSRILLGCDTRPTGKAIANIMIQALLTVGCEIHYVGITAAPEIMAWARTFNEPATGFIYISASHNPIGHNGLKFGLTDGGVLAADEALKLIVDFRAFLDKEENLERINKIVESTRTEKFFDMFTGFASVKEEAWKAYYDFCSEVVAGEASTGIFAALKDGLAKRPLGIVCDFNGSARTVSIDRDFFSALGLKFEYINGKPGEIVHRIVPEGESLEPCCRLLESAHERDASFLLGYVPDCDGDRGNLVIWDHNVLDGSTGNTRALEAQEVFALACIAELAHLAWTGEDLSKTAVAVNDPTSMRIDCIAKAFGASVFRAEVGEANVVGLARRLREQGYIVRILGEGSAGGNITHPSAVRDPINTVLALVKLLSLRSTPDKQGLFELWCKKSGQADKYREDFSLADIIASLPQFISTPAYSKDAIMRINTKDHALLKERYQKIFLHEWEERKEELKTRYGFYSWEAIAYNGLEEKRGISHFKEAGKGGLKISFMNEAGVTTAYIWMRGSATEPVFRIMADTKGMDKQAEQDLLVWQRSMISLADKE